MKPIQFKILQRRLKFRNPNNLIDIPDSLGFSSEDALAAEKYLVQLKERRIDFTYPGHENYPAAFLRMKEPPLFLEYKGPPVWKQTPHPAHRYAAAALPVPERNAACHCGSGRKYKQCCQLIERDINGLF